MPHLTIGQVHLVIDVAANWSRNPILSDGELGWDSDNSILKIGDGSTPWAQLDAAITVSGGGGGSSAATDISFDNAAAQIPSNPTQVQAAIDGLVAALPTILDSIVADRVSIFASSASSDGDVDLTEDTGYMTMVGAGTVTLPNITDDASGRAHVIIKAPGVDGDVVVAGDAQINGADSLTVDSWAIIVPNDTRTAWIGLAAGGGGSGGSRTRFFAYGVAGDTAVDGTASEIVFLDGLDAPTQTVSVDDAAGSTFPVLIHAGDNFGLWHPTPFTYDPEADPPVDATPWTRDDPQPLSLDAVYIYSVGKEFIALGSDLVTPGQETTVYLDNGIPNAGIDQLIQLAALRTGVVVYNSDFNFALNDAYGTRAGTVRTTASAVALVPSLDPGAVSLVKVGGGPLTINTIGGDQIGPPSGPTDTTIVLPIGFYLLHADDTQWNVSRLGGTAQRLVTLADSPVMLGNGDQDIWVDGTDGTVDITMPDPTTQNRSDHIRFIDDNGGGLSAFVHSATGAPDMDLAGLQSLDYQPSYDGTRWRVVGATAVPFED